MFFIKYHSGVQNVDADALSRYGRVAVESEVVKAIILSGMVPEQQAPLANSITDTDDLAVILGEQPDPDSDLLEAFSLSSKDWLKAHQGDLVLREVMSHITAGTRPSAMQTGPSDKKVTNYVVDW